MIHPDAPGTAYEVRWPDGGIYANRHGETVLTEDEAKATAPAIGGTWHRAVPPADETLARLRAAMAGETPLEGLDEQIRHDGAEWIAVSPGGRLWVIRWFSGTGNVAGIDGNSYVTRFRGTAADLPAARREAARIAALIADGKTKED
jgi:hypothetical protein